MIRKTVERDAERKSRTSISKRDRQETSRSNSRSDPIASLHRAVGNQAVKEIYERGELLANRTSSGFDEASNREYGDDGTIHSGRATPAIATSATIRSKRIEDETRTIDGSQAQRIQFVTQGGRRLPNDALDFFEPRFGCDFSDIRVHTGSKADEAAKSLNADAFTYGRNVVFRSGQYDPTSLRRSRLLAHELTHVVQQRGRDSSSRHTASFDEDVRITRTDSELEREADRMAETVMQPSGPVNSPESATPDSADTVSGGTGRLPVIQRQSTGMRVSSPVVDETLRQAGAVAGALSGRPLSPDERDLARSVFDKSIDYDRVRLSTAGPTWTTAGNVIFVPSDFSIADTYHASVLIHEMAHVWQYQHGGSEYISVSLGRQFWSYLRTGSRAGAYDYEITPGKSIFDYMPEQQAAIVQTYFILRQRKARLEEEGRSFPVELERNLQRHERLVTELTRALPRSEVELLERSMQRTMSLRPVTPPGEDTGALSQPSERRTPTIPLLEIRF